MIVGYNLFDEAIGMDTFAPHGPAAVSHSTQDDDRSAAFQTMPTFANPRHQMPSRPHEFSKELMDVRHA